MIQLTYYEMCIIEGLRELDEWWYDMNDFAKDVEYPPYMTRIILDSLCLKGVVEKLIDDFGEGYYLNEEKLNV